MSLLKKKIGLLHASTKELTLVGTEGNIILEPVVVLGRRLIKRNNQTVAQALIQWSRTSS